MNNFWWTIWEGSGVVYKIVCLKAGKKPNGSNWKFVTWTCPGFALRSKGKDLSIFAEPQAKKKRPRRSFFFGGLPGARTLEPSIKSRMLYQLS